MLNATVYALQNALNFIPNLLDSQLKECSPSTIIGMMVVAKFAVSYFASHFKPRWEESYQELLGRKALNITYVQKRYNSDIDREYDAFKITVREQWKQFGTPQIKLPEEAWTQGELIALTEKYTEATTALIAGKHFSGAIYPRSLTQAFKKDDMESSQHDNQLDYFEELAAKSEDVFTHAYKRSYLWNSLHNKEFAVASFIEYQVVRIVADMFGGAPDTIQGFVTTGGSDSLMQAVRIYKEWGRKNRGHMPGESVVIAGSSVHAAVLKAGETYDVRIVLVECDATGRIDLSHLKAAMQHWGTAVVAIIGSTPSYATGVIDPIAEMGVLAQNYGCGLHVDACLGSFIINHLPQHQSNFLQLPGVTTLSADTHKNGLAPKGTSVLVTKKLGVKNLAYYSIYAFPKWKGGVYATPRAPGSEPCTPALSALLALLGTSQRGYKRAAEAIHSSSRQLATAICSFEGVLKLIAPPEVNVVAFGVDAAAGWRKGAIYALAHEMHARNIVLNCMNEEIVHMCVTVRFASDPAGLEKFTTALRQSVEAVKHLNDTGALFPGDAGMYCALDNALAPSVKTLTFQKYLENSLVGGIGAKDAARAYWLARLDPYDSQPWQ